MPKRPEADVIVTADRDALTVDRCVRTVLAQSGHALRRLLLIDDLCPDGPGPEAIERLVKLDERVVLVQHPTKLGPVGSCNRGMVKRGTDAVLLNKHACVVGPDWLTELAAVAHSDERTACVSPLTDVGGICSVPEMKLGTPSATSTETMIAETLVREACARLPRWTVAPILESSCIYLRGDVIDAVGMLDLKCKSVDAAVNNWVSRAQVLGFAAKRANHTYVQKECVGQDLCSTDTPPTLVSPCSPKRIPISSTSLTGSAGRSTGTWRRTRYASRRPARSASHMTSGICRPSRSAPAPTPSVWDDAWRRFPISN